MRETVSVRIPDIDRDGMRRAADRIEHLIMPRRALGRLLELGEKVAGITGFDAMDVSKKTIVVMAGDHGVTEEGVSAYPQEVTGQMVRGFVAGGAGINVLSRHAGIDIRLVDMGCAADFADLVRSGAVIDAKIARGTRNMKKGPAMSRAEAVRCIEAGIAVARDAVAAGARMIGTGDMGIGNTTPSTAIASVVTGAPVARIVGRGTGIDDDRLALKQRVIEESITVNNPDRTDAIDVLSKIGGFEIGGIAGLCLGAAERRIPVVVDGVISTAGAILAWLIDRRMSDYLFAAHRSVEEAQRVMLAQLGLEPILDLGMRLGEGTGCALAMPVIEAGVKVIREMATFEEAGVSKG